ncbi:hypothetical protein ABBQ32_004005 [Trebouxia sp. C0010 RCD-2024]
MKKGNFCKTMQQCCLMVRHVVTTCLYVIACCALVIPDIPELKRSILQKLHGANYSGHVGYHRTIHNVNRMYWWQAWLLRFVNTFRVARHVRKTSITLLLK